MIDRMAEGNVKKNVGVESSIVLRQELGRKIFLQIHRTIGLFAGAVVVLVGLSGGILAFREDIDEWLNASVMRVEIPAQASLARSMKFSRRQSPQCRRMPNRRDSRCRAIRERP